MSLRIPSLEDCYKVLEWRKTNPETYRTPYDISRREQALFYQNIVCNPNSRCRYLVATSDCDIYAFGGLTSIDYINGNAEITLVLDPACRNHGYGKEVVNEFLWYARNRLRLETVYGECYMCSPAVRFWQRIADNTVVLPRRKYWEGEYYDSLYFTFFLEKLDEPAVQ